MRTTTGHTEREKEQPASEARLPIGPHAPLLAGRARDAELCSVEAFCAVAKRAVDCARAHCHRSRRAGRAGHVGIGVLESVHRTAGTRGARRPVLALFSHEAVRNATQQGAMSTVINCPTHLDAEAVDDVVVVGGRRTHSDRPRDAPAQPDVVKQEARKVEHATERFPAVTHEEQMVLPVLATYWPLPHTVQLSWAVAVLIVPIAQSVHADVRPEADLYLLSKP